MWPEERSGAEGAMWDALLTNLDDNDREHAQQRVWQSIEEDRSRALTSPTDQYTNEPGER